MTDKKKRWMKPLIRRIYPTPELIELLQKKSEKAIPGELLECLSRRAEEPPVRVSMIDHELQRKVLRELGKTPDRRHSRAEGKRAA